MEGNRSMRMVVADGYIVSVEVLRILFAKFADVACYCCVVLIEIVCVGRQWLTYF